MFRPFVPVSGDGWHASDRPGTLSGVLQPAFERLDHAFGDSEPPSDLLEPRFAELEPASGHGWHGFDHSRPVYGGLEPRYDDPEPVSAASTRVSDDPEAMFGDSVPAYRNPLHETFAPGRRRRPAGMLPERTGPSHLTIWSELFRSIFRSCERVAATIPLDTGNDSRLIWRIRP
jgi:hypothetical protein